MKKTLLSLALIGLSTSAIAAETYNGRLSGMSGAGYVTASYSDGVLLNPSLGASFGESDDFALVINAGALGSDQDDLLEGAEDLADYLDAFDRNSPLTEETAEEIKRLLNGVDDRSALVNASGSLVLAIPNNFLSIALVAQSYAGVSVTADVDDDDYALLDGQIGDEFDPEDPINGLKSSVIGMGAVVTEVGVALSKSFTLDENKQWLLGVTPKRVTVESIVYTATVASFDEDDLDADDYTVENSSTNLDVGVTYIAGNLRYGLSARNLKEESFETIDPLQKIEIKQQLTTAVGYASKRVKAEIAADLNAVPSLSMTGESQFVRAGVEVSAFSWLQLRAGFRQDLKDTQEDTYSVGLGLSPFDVVNLDIAAVKGSGETLGAALQLGLRF